MNPATRQPHPSAAATPLAPAPADRLVRARYREAEPQRALDHGPADPDPAAGSGAPFIAGLTAQLKEYQALCEEAMALTAREGQALAAPGEYQSFAFCQERKALLSRLGDALSLLRTWRLAWQRLDPAERARYPEVKRLLQAVQDLLVKTLLLDRENQQALLRRGLLPARHVPSFAAQQPHYAASLYRRHSS